VGIDDFFVFILILKKGNERKTLQLGQNFVKGKEDNTQIGYWFGARHDNVHFTIQTDKRGIRKLGQRYVHRAK
jgi:hypothetical protein